MPVASYMGRPAGGTMGTFIIISTKTKPRLERMPKCSSPLDLRVKRKGTKLETSKPEDAVVIIRQLRANSYNGKSKTYDDEQWHLILVCHVNPSRGEEWLRMDRHIDDPAELIYEVYQAEFTDWFIKVAQDSGVWIDDVFFSPEYIRRAIEDGDEVGLFDEPSVRDIGQPEG